MSGPWSTQQCLCLRTRLSAARTLTFWGDVSTVSLLGPPCQGGTYNLFSQLGNLRIREGCGHGPVGEAGLSRGTWCCATLCGIPPDFVPSMARTVRLGAYPSWAEGCMGVGRCPWPQSPTPMQGLLVPTWFHSPSPCGNWAGEGPGALAWPLMHGGMPRHPQPLKEPEGAPCTAGPGPLVGLSSGLMDRPLPNTIQVQEISTPLCA